jgi:hypothetical protein
MPFPQRRAAAKDRAKLEMLVKAIKANPMITYRQIEEETGINSALIRDMAAKAGFQKDGKTGSKMWVEND